VAKGKNKEVLYRVVKFEARLNHAQQVTLERVSGNLRQVWNEALAERQSLFDTHIAPLYQRLKETKGNAEEEARIRAEIKIAFRDHTVTLFDQINSLTEKRRNDPEGFGSVPRNWQEETLDTLNGAFASFMALRKKGDPDARTPGVRYEDCFCEIPGRGGFKVSTTKQHIILNAGKHCLVELCFPIPEYQQDKLCEAVRIKKFTLYRDERNMKKVGRFWISIAYEITKPQALPFYPEEAVYVAIGATSLGIVSPDGEEVVKLWRPDRHWKPEIESVEQRMKLCGKVGSRKWCRRNRARQRMNRLMALQQKQGQRETAVHSLLSHGHHFVVTELIVRSKADKLADSDKPERGGSLGLNWSAQNTGNIARLVDQLTEKALERGGSVRKHKVVLSSAPAKTGHENKIEIARALRASFLQSAEADSQG